AMEKLFHRRPFGQSENFPAPRQHGLGQRNQPAPEIANEASSQVTASVGGADKDHALHERQRCEKEQMPKSLPLRFSYVQLVNWFGATCAPEPIAGFDSCALSQQAALAVADNHHLTQRRVFAFRVELLDHGGERVAQFTDRKKQRVSAAVNETPELAAVAQFRIDDE